jgi:hypothetical protein
MGTSKQQRKHPSNNVNPKRLTFVLEFWIHLLCKKKNFKLFVCNVEWGQRVQTTCWLGKPTSNLGEAVGGSGCAQSNKEPIRWRTVSAGVANILGGGQVGITGKAFQIEHSYGNSNSVPHLHRPTSLPWSLCTWHGLTAQIVWCAWCAWDWDSLKK